jgi:hypothetical protein
MFDWDVDILFYFTVLYAVLIINFRIIISLPEKINSPKMISKNALKVRNFPNNI